MAEPNSIERLRVELDDRGYDILVGPGLIARAGAEMLLLMRRRQAVIVTDETVAAQYLAPFRANLEAHGIAQHVIMLPPGEGTKDLAHFGRLVDDILACGIERGTMLVALGGGVCDLEPAAVTRAILTSCRMKAVIVAADEREEGDRALLNFGHTFGHALETETGFGDALLHGEAVALGMVLAFDFAVRLGIANGQDAHRVRRHLAAAGLPTNLSEIGLSSSDAADRLVAHMGKDKKVRDGRITLILP